MSTQGFGRTLTIRPASPDDIPSIIELAQKIWRAHYPGIIPAAQVEYMLSTMYAPERIEAEIREPSMAYFIADVDGAGVGFAAIGSAAETQTAKLHKLYVLPEVQGTGIGRALMQAALDHAGAQGKEEVILAVNKRNQKAIAAYYRWGFRQRDAVMVDIGGGFVMDDYIFEIAAPRTARH